MYIGCLSCIALPQEVRGHKFPSWTQVQGPSSFHSLEVLQSALSTGWQNSKDRVKKPGQEIAPINSTLHWLNPSHMFHLNARQARRFSCHVYPERGNGIANHLASLRYIKYLAEGLIHSKTSVHKRYNYFLLVLIWIPEITEPQLDFSQHWDWKLNTNQNEHWIS